MNLIRRQLTTASRSSVSALPSLLCTPAAARGAPEPGLSSPCQLRQVGQSRTPASRDISPAVRSIPYNRLAGAAAAADGAPEAGPGSQCQPLYSRCASHLLGCTHFGQGKPASSTPADAKSASWQRHLLTHRISPETFFSANQRCFGTGSAQASVHVLDPQGQFKGPLESIKFSTELQKLVDLSKALQDESADVDHALPIADAKELFSKLTTAELANALLNLQLASNETVVDAASAILTSRVIMGWRATSLPLLWAVKRTAHAHFCAGETVEEACQTLERMWALGMRGILDFSVEDALDDATCDRNLEGFIHTIQHSRSLPPQSVSFACVKLTALCPLPVLEHASALIRQHHSNPNPFAKPSWMLPSLPVLADASPPYPSPPSLLAPLSKTEIDAWHATYERLRRICQECHTQGLPLLVDAEYQSVEPAVDHLAYAAALEFNKGSGMPLVYATVQCYLKDALPRLERSFQEAQRLGVPFGVKLVRGAYLSRESEVAQRHGTSSPIFSRIEDTHACYNTCAAFMIGAAAERLKDASGPQAAVMLATHNYDSGRRAVLCAAHAGLGRRDPRLQFAQLKGMADGLSLTLALSGFNISKYLPYGRVEEVMPYLLRRAQENRGVLGNTREERRRLWSELKRRFLAPLSFNSS